MILRMEEKFPCIFFKLCPWLLIFRVHTVNQMDVSLLLCTFSADELSNIRHSICKLCLT